MKLLQRTFASEFRHPAVQPRMLKPRLRKMEKVCLKILKDAGCWDETLDDLMVSRFFAKSAESRLEVLLRDRATSKAVRYAASCLAWIQHLQDLLSQEAPRANAVAMAAIMVEGTFQSIKLDNLAARARGSVRVRSRAEEGKEQLSVLIYLLAREVAKEKVDNRDLSTMQVYEMVCHEAGPNEVYRPSSTDALKVKIHEWRKKGLTD